MCTQDPDVATPMPQPIARFQPCPPGAFPQLTEKKKKLFLATLKKKKQALKKAKEMPTEKKKKLFLEKKAKEILGWMRAPGGMFFDNKDGNINEVRINRA